MAVPRFAVRHGSIDADVYNLVVNLNEYALPERFARDDTVIDVGAHIGTFSYAALNRGAGSVVAVEPDPLNAAIARRALAAYAATGRFELVEAAVWGDEDTALFHHGYPTMPGGKLNTGGGRVSDDPRGQPVRTIALDDLIDLALARRPGTRVRLLKLDCEGAEWPILLDAARLGDVDAIAGELHQPGDPSVEDRLPGGATLDGVGELLDSLGFTVRLEGPVTDDPYLLGKFFAQRNVAPRRAS